MVGLTILGSTGSIGRSTLDVVARHPDRFEVFALGARRNVGDLLAQCRRYRPRYAVMADGEAAEELGRRARDEGLATEVLGGEEALDEVAAHREVDAVMAAIVGAAGLRSTLAAARAGKRVLLANKEALVVAGALLMAAVRESGATLLPIDSEHNALFQCMPDGYVPGRRPEGVRRLVLTASGGPFRGWPADRLEKVTPDEACAHPNWDMGRKISVDSATMMNKGLEVIEACWLYDMPADEVEVVVHPQSVIHSLVDYEDGSMLAQLGRPDMRTPIAHALAWPERAAAGVRPLDLVEVGRLDFERPDPDRFRCLGLAFRAVRDGATVPAVLNAANEVAVAAFLDERIGFLRIPQVIEAMVERFHDSGDESLDGLMALDRSVRDAARAWIDDARTGTGGTRD